MTKRRLDKYFSTEYDEIKLYVQKSFSKHNIWNEEPDFFVSEIYLYLLEKIEEIDSEKTLKSYIGTFIHNHCYWNNSEVREAERYGRRIRNSEFIPHHHDNLTDDVYAQNEMEKINEYKAVVEMYYASLKSLEKKAVWEIYFIEGKQTAKSFGEYIQMSRTVSTKFIKELKKDINKFYDDYKKQ